MNEEFELLNRRINTLTIRVKALEDRPTASIDNYKDILSKVVSFLLIFLGSTSQLILAIGPDIQAQYPNMKIVSLSLQAAGFFNLLVQRINNYKKDSDIQKGNQS